MYYTSLRLFTVYYMLPFPEKGYYCISRSNRGPAARQPSLFLSIMQVFFFFLQKRKQLASDANALRVNWIGDHLSMDDTYWQRWQRVWRWSFLYSHLKAQHLQIGSVLFFLKSHYWKVFKLCCHASVKCISQISCLQTSFLARANRNIYTSLIMVDLANVIQARLTVCLFPIFQLS